MVIEKYKVAGIHCDSCRGSIKDSLSEVRDLVAVTVDGDVLGVSSPDGIEQTHLERALPNKFKLTQLVADRSMAEVSTASYKPLIIITLYIVGVSLVLEWFSADGFSMADWMRYFMAGFFIVFSFFKLLDLSGFAKSYAMYDIIAAKWGLWGRVYPFVELGLGLAFLTGFCVLELNVFTLVLLSVGTIGVVQSNIQKKKIQCACLGTVFNLPMTKVTIIENVIMIGMALIVIVTKLLFA